MKTSSNLQNSRSHRIARVAATLTLATTAIVAPLTHYTGATAHPAALTDVTVAAKGWVLHAPASIPAGLVRFTVTGATNPQGTMAIVAQLHPGVSRAQVVAAISKGDPAGMLKILTPFGGPFGIGTPRAIVSLTAGSYVVFDIEQDAQGKSHALYQFFAVATAATSSPEPASTTTVTELDMKFRVPATVAAGDTVLKIVNRGPSAHETILGKLHPGTTVKALVAYLKQENPSGPPPVDFIGVGAVMASGHTQWAPTHLTTGTYVLLCFITDKHGIPHAMDGMVKTFTVL